MLSRFERKGLKVIGLKMVQPSRSLVLRHYEEHKEKNFFEDLVSFFMSGPIICAVCEGPEAVELCRIVIGKTFPSEALMGSIRGDFCAGKGRNLVHGSDSVDSAAREIGIWFEADELMVYEKAVDKWVKQPNNF